MVSDAKESIEERHSVVHDEKGTMPEYLHKYIRAGLGEEDAEFMHRISETEQDKIFHKVDWRLCPMLAVLYLISHLDRQVHYRLVHTQSLMDTIQSKHWQCENRRSRRHPQHAGH